MCVAAFKHANTPGVTRYHSQRAPTQLPPSDHGRRHTAIYHEASWHPIQYNDWRQYDRQFAEPKTLAVTTTASAHEQLTRAYGNAVPAAARTCRAHVGTPRTPLRYHSTYTKGTCITDSMPPYATRARERPTARLSAAQIPPPSQLSRPNNMHATDFLTSKKLLVSSTLLFFSPLSPSRHATPTLYPFSLPQTPLPLPSSPVPLHLCSVDALAAHYRSSTATHQLRCNVLHLLTPSPRASCWWVARRPRPCTTPARSTTAARAAAPGRATRPAG